MNDELLESLRSKALLILAEGWIEPAGSMAREHLALLSYIEHLQRRLSELWEHVRTADKAYPPQVLPLLRASGLADRVVSRPDWLIPDDVEDADAA